MLSATAKIDELLAKHFNEDEVPAARYYEPETAAEQAEAEDEPPPAEDEEPSSKP